MNRLNNYLYLPVFLLFGIGVVYLFSFTAEDAYITYRYAENLVNTGALVFNDGEAINAMTSPFHVLLSSVLFYATGATVLSNKLLALFLLLISAVLLWHRFRSHTEAQLLVFSLILLPSCVLLWTFGGLETPFLLFLVTITIVFVDFQSSLCLALNGNRSFWRGENSGSHHNRSIGSTFSLQTLIVIYLLAGLGFLIRYDSVLFFIPVVLYSAFRARSRNHVLIALLIGALLPISWIAISFMYYGDILPTSFYVKTPSITYAALRKNALYMFLNLIYAGIIPVILVLLLNFRRTVIALNQTIKTMWWLYTGLAFVLLYGLSMATTHMMFSFRFFVPYLPATVLMVLSLIVCTVKATERTKQPFASSTAIFRIFFLCLLLFQGWQIWYVYNQSVNGPSLIGEYQALSVRDYIRFIETLKQESVNIQIHWGNIQQDANRRARIHTYAGGMLPYTFQDAYIYERLVSYRHDDSWKNSKLSADYIHIVAPRHGSVANQLPKSVDSYTLISSYTLDFDGSRQNFLVYYNPNPQPHALAP